MTVAPKERIAFSTSASNLQKLVEQTIRHEIGKSLERTGPQDIYRALACVLRPLLLGGMEDSEKRFAKVHNKRLYYLSAEFLIGQSLRNNLLNLGLSKIAATVAKEFGFDLEEVFASEPDAGLYGALALLGVMKPTAQILQVRL